MDGEYIGIMEKKMETTILGLGFGIQSVELRVVQSGPRAFWGGSDTLLIFSLSGRDSTCPQGTSLFVLLMDRVGREYRNTLCRHYFLLFPLRTSKMKAYQGTFRGCPG